MPAAGPALLVVQVSRRVRDRGAAKMRGAWLGGGVKKRGWASARAGATARRIRLLAEPLGALDEKIRREMQVELKSIQRRSGTTFLYVTHDQEEALTMSDRVA